MSKKYRQYARTLILASIIFLFLIVFILVSNIWSVPTMDNSLRLPKTLGITYISKDQRNITKNSNKNGISCKVILRLTVRLKIYAAYIWFSVQHCTKVELFPWIIIYRLDFGGSGTNSSRGETRTKQRLNINMKLENICSQHLPNNKVK